MTTIQLVQLQAWLGGLLWAFGRVSGMCLVAPVFSATMIPMRIRLIVALVLTAVLAPLAPTQVDLLTGEGFVTMASQLLIGVAIGFVLQLAFQAVQFGAQLISQSMNLGFAESINPLAGGSSAVLGQIYGLLVTLLFLAMDGHLHLIQLLADSFHSLPPGVATVSADGLHAIASFGTQFFAGAVRVALPAMTSLLVVNIGFAAISRAAPSMNLFAVGFPITVTLGFIALWLSLRSLHGAFDAIQESAWSLMRELVGG
ncbi:flagellar biosynthetic protein FliR [Dyella sp.]|uniref:flagellar biosynthetic protein FliR n=1 Tax=Dyella sp. TaxID=1869338 RepID=UPI002ED5DC77